MEKDLAQVVVGKWGRTLAIRLPAEVVKAVGMRQGEHLEIEAHDGAIMLRKANPRLTLEELFRGKTPQEWQRAYADGFDWGPDVGREVVEE